MSHSFHLMTVGDDGGHRGMGRLDKIGQWTLSISGEVERPLSFTLEQLDELPRSELALEIVCVSAGKGIYDPRGEKAVFSGVALAEVLKAARPQTNQHGNPLAQSMRFVSRAPAQCGPLNRRHDTSLEYDLCATPGQVLLARRLNEEPLSYANGGPLRSVVDGRGADGKGRYFYKSLKWLDAIELVADSVENCPGAWERYAGYDHYGRVGETKLRPFFGVMEDNGDVRLPDNPLDELNRMLSDGDLSRLVSARLDTYANLFDHRWSKHRLRFTSQELSNNRPLYSAALRHANLRRRDLRGWNLSYVNFSLSSFTGATLGDADPSQAAVMRGCDCEGANFAGADMRNVDFSETYLAGAVFERGGKIANVEGLDVAGAHGMTDDICRWLHVHGAVV